MKWWRMTLSLVVAALMLTSASSAQVDPNKPGGPQKSPIDPDKPGGPQRSPIDPDKLGGPQRGPVDPPVSPKTIERSLEGKEPRDSIRSRDPLK